MHNTSFLMQVFQRFGNLNNDVSRKVLAEVCKAYNLVEELTTWAQLQDDVVILLRLAKLHELHNIGVVQISHDLHFFEDVRSLREEIERQFKSQTFNGL
jgi:hypothetical protein